MAVDDPSSLWRASVFVNRHRYSYGGQETTPDKTPRYTVHGGKHKGSGMKMMDGVIRKLPVKYENGSIDLIEIDGIFYLEAQGEKTLIRTRLFR
jgi:hypothetical protein